MNQAQKDYISTLTELIKNNKVRVAEEPGAASSYYQGKVDAYTLAHEYFINSLKTEANG